MAKVQSAMHEIRMRKMILCGEETSLAAATKCASFATLPSGPVPARNADPEAIHALPRPAGKPNLAEERCSWRAQGDGKSSVQLQVFASSGLRLAQRRATFTTPLHLPPSMAWAMAKACL
jgi:hypothetical protein